MSGALAAASFSQPCGAPTKKPERGYAALLMLRPLDFLFSDSGAVCGHLYGPPERDVRALSSGQLF